MRERVPFATAGWKGITVRWALDRTIMASMTIAKCPQKRGGICVDERGDFLFELFAEAGELVL